MISSKRVLIIVLLSLVVQSVYAQEFVQVMDKEFKFEGGSYRFMGTNYWYGMYLGMDNEYGDRERLNRELDQLKELGLTNLRILGSSEGNGDYQITPALLQKKGKYNKDVMDGLDYFLNELRKREMKAVVVLNNFWMWSGGMPQYVSWAENSEIPLPDIENGGGWDTFIAYSMKFYENQKSQRLYQKHLKKILNHKNQYSGLKYKDDNTIMSWQLANEPRGYNNAEGYREWIRKTSNYIKSIDPNHLISVGAEGNTGSPYAGVDLFLDNNFKSIDYATVHVWIQNWSWFDPTKPETFKSAMENTKEYLNSQLSKADSLGKPVVIEEFGVSRDNAEFGEKGSVIFRNNLYEFIFEYTYSDIVKGGLIQGCNFWSWGGEGRPNPPGGMWETGQDYIGDPPHERQGWYSVYDTDHSTHELIKKYSLLINRQLYGKK